MCQLTPLWMRPRVAEHFAQGSAMLTIETEQLVALSKLYIKHSTLVSMLVCGIVPHDSARVRVPGELRPLGSQVIQGGPALLLCDPRRVAARR